MACISSGIIIKFDDIHGVGIIEPDEGFGLAKIKFSHKHIQIQGFKMPNEGQRVDYMIDKANNGRNCMKVWLRD